MLVAHRVNNPAFVVVVVVVPAKCGYLDVGAADAIARSIALFATFRPAICACCVVCVSLCTDDDDKNFFEFFFWGKKKHKQKRRKKRVKKRSKKQKKSKKKGKKKGMDDGHTMDKKKVKTKDREQRTKKKREKRPKKGSRRFRTRVELRALDEKNKKQIFLPHFTHRLPCPPKRRKRRRRRRRGTNNESSRVAPLFVFVLFSREEKGCERCRTISESRVASRESRARFGFGCEMNRFGG